jgi:hypothetical protein
MTDRSKFEQMLEHLINEDEQKAKELFHDIVVAKSREIYETLISEDFEEMPAEEEMPTEGEEMDMEEEMPEEEPKMEEGEEMPEEENTPEAEVEDLLMQIEELRSEVAALTAIIAEQQ